MLGVSNLAQAEGVFVCFLEDLLCAGSEGYFDE